ncbi:MAG: DUF362 domain-containing protein [Myxococcota bacterium]
MAELADEQRAQLQVWEERYRGRPNAELRRLLLLALEREQLVAIAYRDRALSTRLRELDVPEEVREAFTQALAWAWRDEQQHTVFTRGLLLGRASLYRKAVAWTQVAMGAVAGWASATQHHATWRRAPLPRAAAGMVTSVGRVVGKVPGSMRKRLRHLGFAEYCQLQCDAEVSAAICWERMTAIARGMPDHDPATTEAFHRMWQHELRHREAFAQMAASVTDRGALVDGCDPGEVVDALRAIGPMFVPRRSRGGALAKHPLGAGGPVVAASGDDDRGGPTALREALQQAGLREVLQRRATEKGVELAALRVVIKPSFMFTYDRRDPSVSTDPQLIDALVAWLREQGVRNIALAETPNLYDRFYGGRSVEEVAAYGGYDGDYAVEDLSAALEPYDYAAGLGPTRIATVWRDADVRITFPKLRSHPVDFAHLGLGGLEGVAGRIDSFLFSERVAERETATLMPLLDHPPHFSVIDGWRHAADGLVGVMACPNPPTPRRLWAGRDALAVDIVAMRHLGITDPTRVQLLATAMTWFGDPRPTTEVRGTYLRVAPWRHPYATTMSALLALVAQPVFQFASARGSVFTPPMDPDAFPSLRDEGWILRARRSMVRRLLGMTLPALPPGRP